MTTTTSLLLAAAAACFGAQLVAANHNNGNGNDNNQAPVFVSVDTSGMEPGWSFAAYRWSSSTGLEIPGTRKTGVVSATDFNSGWNEPPPALYGFGTEHDYLAIVWTGFLKITVEGVYRFELGSDDGSRLYIDGREVSDAP
jgi:hypothetical protein